MCQTLGIAYQFKRYVRLFFIACIMQLYNLQIWTMCIFCQGIVAFIALLYIYEGSILLYGWHLILILSLQIYKPGYVAPPARPSPDETTIDLRQALSSFYVL